jgi:hypothetical protein
MRSALTEATAPLSSVVLRSTRSRLSGRRKALRITAGQNGAWIHLQGT